MYNNFFVETLGYRNTIMLKDFIVFLIGITLGGLLLALLFSNIGHRIIQDKNLKPGTAYRHKIDGKYIYYLNFEDAFQVFEFIFAVFFFPFLFKDGYSLEEKIHIHFTLILALVILFFLIAIGVYFVTNPIIL